MGGFDAGFGGEATVYGDLVCVRGGKVLEMKKDEVYQKCSRQCQDFESGSLPGTASRRRGFRSLVPV